MILVQRDLITMLHGILLVAFLRFDGVEHKRQIMFSYRESKQCDFEARREEKVKRD